MVSSLHFVVKLMICDTGYKQINYFTEVGCSSFVLILIAGCNCLPPQTGPTDYLYVVGSVCNQIANKISAKLLYQSLPNYNTVFSPRPSPDVIRFWGV